MPLPTVAQNAPYAWMIQGASSVGLPTPAQGAPYVWVIPADNSGNYAQTIVSVTSFGALPTNTAAQNDTAIAAAIASFPSNGPGVLLFPMIGNGVYQVSNAITIDKDNISLIGLGNRLGAPTIQTNTDNAYQVIVGNTKNVNNVLIQGLNFQGLNSTTSTGGGINFRCAGGGIIQCRIALFGGSGINIAAFSGSINEVFLENVTLISNGMNSTTPGDNLVIAGSCTDSEYIRVISLGNSARNTTRHCITNSGSTQKFVNCHCYFANQNGFNQVSGTNVQIIGGEFETNGNDGILLNGTNNTVIGVHCFSNNGSADIELDSGDHCIIMGNKCTSSVVADNILMFGVTTSVIADNSCSGSAISINGNAACANLRIHDNICSGATGISFAGTAVSFIHDNFGFNPQGVAAIAVTASPFTYTAGNTYETVYITGGTITTIVKNSITLYSAITNVAINLDPGEAVVVTYTAAPTMNKDRH